MAELQSSIAHYLRGYFCRSVISSRQSRQDGTGKVSGLSGIWKAIRLDPTGSTSDNIGVIAFETLKGKSWLGQTPSSQFSRNTMCVT